MNKIKKLLSISLFFFSLLLLSHAQAEHVYGADSTDIMRTKDHPRSVLALGSGTFRSKGYTQSYTNIPACPDGFVGSVSTAVSNLTMIAARNQFFDGWVNQGTSLCVSGKRYRVDTEAYAVFNSGGGVNYTQEVIVAYSIHCTPTHPFDPSYHDRSC